MIDQNSQFMAILTAVGEAKQSNADALGVPWTFAQMGVGDAGGADPIPDRAQTKLINEQRRAPLNQVRIHPKNSNVIIAEQVIPENVGGWWIREIGLYDADGDLVAVANCAPSFKPLLAQGSGKTQVVRMNFIVTSAANVTLKIDPSVVLATRQYVDEQIIDVLPATRTPGTYTKVVTDRYGVVIEGSNPQTLAAHGIKDAYTQTQIDAALKELSDALGGDLDFATTLIARLKNKADTATSLRVGSVSQQIPILAASKSGSAYDAAALIVRESGEVGAAQEIEAYAPAIGFHWLGHSTGRLIMDALGTLKWNGKPLLAARIASQIEVESGSNDTAVVTPPTLRFGFNFIKGGGGANNAIVLPTWLGGLMIQWGVHLADTPDAEATVTFPLAFNVIPGCVSWFTHDSAALGQSGVTTQGRGLTATGFQSRREDIGTVFYFSGTAYIRWIAIGY